MTYILIADIGGTNARFARVDAQGIHDVQVLSVDTKQYKTPIDAAKAYIEMTKGLSKIITMKRTLQTNQHGYFQNRHLKKPLA
jgi:glucokinase